MTQWRRDNPEHFHEHPDKVAGVSLTLEELVGLRREVNQLLMRNRRYTQSHLLGSQRARFKGRGMDFDEVRPYQPGDDIRSIDWRVTARTGKPHTKLFREERERPVFILLDQRSRMFFGSKTAFKSVIASRLAATTIWSAIAQGQRVGALLFDGHSHSEIKPSHNRRNTLGVLQSIVQRHERQLARVYGNATSEPTAPTSNTERPLSAALERLRHICRPGSLIYCFSDFYQFDDACKSALQPLCQHSELQAVQVYDPLEKELPPPGVYPVSMQNKLFWMNAQGKNSRAEYANDFQRKERELKQFLLQHSARFLSLSTADGLSHGLQRLQSALPAAGVVA